MKESLSSNGNGSPRKELLSPELLRIQRNLEGKVEKLRRSGLLQGGVRLPKGILKLL